MVFEDVLVQGVGSAAAVHEVFEELDQVSGDLMRLFVEFTQSATRP